MTKFECMIKTVDGHTMIEEASHTRGIFSSVESPNRIHEQVLKNPEGPSIGDRLLKNQIPIYAS